MGTFIIKKQKDGQFMFNLKAGNGEIIFTSEGYTTKQNCKNGIASVVENAHREGAFVEHTHDDLDHNIHFTLYGENGEIIGRSEIYVTEAGMKHGINSVKKNTLVYTISDRTTWWWKLFS